jgi:hypothetical protein
MRHRHFQPAADGPGNRSRVHGGHGEDYSVALGPRVENREPGTVGNELAIGKSCHYYHPFGVKMMAL